MSAGEVRAAPRRFAWAGGDRSRRRVYVLPTRFGAVYVLVVLATLVGCINYLLSLGYALTFLLLSVWVVCAVHASRALGSAQVAVRPPERAFAGQPVQLQVTVGGALPDAPVGVRSGPVLVWLNEPEAAGTLALPPFERGPQRLPGLRLEGHDPLGLWRSTFYPETDPNGVPLPTGLLVAPAPELHAPPPPLAARPGLAAETRRAAGEEEVHGLREYRPGDAPRRIAWKQAARTGSLLSRTYDAPQSAALALDWAATVPAGNTEARLSRLCAWVLEAERRGCEFSLLLPAERLEAGSGDAQVSRALDLLAHSGRPPLPAAPRRRWPVSPWSRP